MYPKLVSLNIPSGWAVTHNSFGNEDPIFHEGRIVNEQFYNENLLVIQPIKFDATGGTLDQEGYCFKLGWFPHANAQGSYRLMLLRGNPQQVVAEFYSKDRNEIRQVIEQCFHLILQNVGEKDIEWTLNQKTKTFDKKSDFALVIKKKVQDYNRYRNRFYYGQLYSLYPPIYYEIPNIVYLTAKTNKMSYNMPKSENQRA